jgi:hypothetical protein
VAPERGALRLTRAALFALSAVGLACAAHLFGGGDGVSPTAALLACPAVMIVVNLLAARQRGPGVLLVVMGLTQLVLHLAFMAASSAQTCTIAGDGHPMAAMPASSAGPARFAVQCGPPMTHHGANGQLWPSGPMLLAHLLATVMLVLVLARGEQAVWALASCLSFRLIRSGPAVRLPVASRLPVPPAPLVRPRPAIPRRGVRRRGPPVPVRAAC